ncbi:hypothetical protein PCE1_001760 [Barthelona sp. PCE]
MLKKLVSFLFKEADITQDDISTILSDTFSSNYTRTNNTHETVNVLQYRKLTSKESYELQQLNLHVPLVQLRQRRRKTLMNLAFDDYIKPSSKGTLTRQEKSLLRRVFNGFHSTCDVVEQLMMTRKNHIKELPNIPYPTR